MPRRSTGCEKCRQRKVRCDEETPRCRRCSEYGVECPGYRPPAENDLKFVDPNRDVLRKVSFEVDHEQSPTGNSAGSSSREYKWIQPLHPPKKIGDSNDISKHHMHRVQLLSTFLDLYLPKYRDETMMSNFAYLANLPNMDMSSPLLQVSIDTLCLVELGAMYEDDRCLQESRTRYVRALPMLAHELAKPHSKQIRMDHVLAVIAILGLCELFSALSRRNNGWISHTSGAQQFIQSNGPDIMGTPLGWLLFHNIRHSSLCMGFVTRKKVFFSEPKWLKVTEDFAQTDPYVALYDLALQVPGILERTDALFVTNNITQTYGELCEDIRRLRALLTNWLRTHYIDTEKEVYGIVDVRDMEAFASMCLDRTFQTVFRFPSVQVANQLQLYWISCMMLDFTLLSIYHRIQIANALPHLRVREIANRDQESVERDLFMEATNYCRSISYCCEPNTGSPGRFGTFLIHIVQSYFEQYGHCNEMEWCKSVRRIINLRSKAETEMSTYETATSTLASAQRNIEHSCKSPICNFRVECCAPAPLLLPGELQKTEHAR